MTRYFLALEFEAEDDRHADALLGFLLGTTDGGYRMGHGCIRQLEDRTCCPECDDSLELGDEAR